MYTLLSTALTGAALIASALAAPAYSAVPSYTKQSDASATAFPLADGFPAPSTDQLRAIELLAHGTLPNGAPPPPGSISQDGITNLQLIQFNENFEVAFFSSLLFNVTTNVTGFEIADKVERDFVLEVLIAVLAVRLRLPPFFPPPDHRQPKKLTSFSPSPARRTARHQRRKRPQVAEPTAHPSVQIHLPHHHVPRRHRARRHLHRRRPRHAAGRD
jgi:hypothetical protein